MAGAERAERQPWEGVAAKARDGRAGRVYVAFREGVLSERKRFTSRIRGQLRTETLGSESRFEANRGAIRHAVRNAESVRTLEPHKAVMRIELIGCDGTSY